MSVADAERPARQPSQLWVTAITLALLWTGFRPRRYAGGSRAETPSGSAERGGDRGRLATTPSEIPARGWKDILLRVYDNISRDRIVLAAAGITFYVVLAIFPAIAALVALYGLFANPASITTHLETLSGILPGGGLQIIKDQITRLTAHSSNTLGSAFLIGLAASVWSANGGMKSLFDGLNLVYGEQENRGLIKLNLVSLTFTAGALSIFLLSIGAIVVLPIALQYLDLGQPIEILVRWTRWLGLLAIVAFAIAVLYRYGPSRTKPRWRWITWGSAFAAVAWLIASLLFSWYAANFASYDKTYGSLGAIIAFMVWIWLSMILFLLGAEIDAEMEHQTVRDSTSGSPKPVGTRGARMADTVGRSTA